MSLRGNRKCGLGIDVLDVFESRDWKSHFWLFYVCFDSVSVSPEFLSPIHSKRPGFILFFGRGSSDVELWSDCAATAL